MDSNVQAKVKTILTLPAHSISGGGCLSDHSKYWTLNSNDITDGGQCLAEKKPNDYGTGIPLHEVKALARVLLPEIQAFFESAEGQREFREWKAKQKIKRIPQLTKSGLEKNTSSPFLVSSLRYNVLLQGEGHSF